MLDFAAGEAEAPARMTGTDAGPSAKIEATPAFRGWRRSPAGRRRELSPPEVQLPKTTATGRIRGTASPVNADAAKIDIAFIGVPNEKANPQGSKGSGELRVRGAGAPPANAIHNSTGVRVRSFPITLDMVLAALPEQSSERRGRGVVSPRKSGRALP